MIKLAVSLGSTEILAQYPASMTLIGVADEIKKRIGISSGLIRLSIGIENHEDLTADIKLSFKALD